MSETVISQLDSVICQIRFRTILSINLKIGLFQDMIKGIYPICSLNQSVKIVDMNVHNFTFSTEDNQWIVSLSMNSLSLTTTSYVSWEDFLNRFKFVFNAFVDCFTPNNIMRIGLRYINAIRPSKIGKNESIDSLVVGKYRSFIHSDLGDVIDTNTSIELKIDDDTICRSRFGTIRFTDNDESGFMIDNDVISMKPVIEISDVDDVLTRHNDISYRLFLEMTTDRIHKGV